MTKSNNFKSLPTSLEVLENIVDRAFYLALRMIHEANRRPGIAKGEPKVGGHPAACSSSKHILAAIHLVTRKPEDYFACKPHVSPIDHALNYLLHNFKNQNGSWMDPNQRNQVMHHLRHYDRSGAPVFQSYHAESDPDGYRYFPSGSVGIPPVNALYTSLAYAFAKDHDFELHEDPTFWCLMGDSEFREGSLMEAMPDAGERQLNNLVWIVDYNRRNLDGTRVTNEKALGGSDADRIVQIGEANGWIVIKLKHGKLREKLFASPGGDEFKRVIDEEFSDFEFQALLGANDPVKTFAALGDKSKTLKKWLTKFSANEIHQAYCNLAGHDLEKLIETFQYAASRPEKPVLIVAYTIKGHGLTFAAKSGNHSAMPEEDELRQIASLLGLDWNMPFSEFKKDSKEETFLNERRTSLLNGIEKIQNEVASRKKKNQEIFSKINWPTDFDIASIKFNPVAHTQWMWGQVAAKLDRLAGRGRNSGAELTSNDKAWHAAARYFLTMAPDVGSSTNTSSNMDGKLYGNIGQEDFEKTYNVKDDKAPDVIPTDSVKTGHLRFEIAEGNCMSAAGSFGKMGSLTGIPFYPAMTIYDFFIKRAHDQLYYNLYWKSHFATIGTPSGITLAPEGAQHSWKSDLQIPHCVTWEPCYAKELEWILADTLRRHFTEECGGRESILIRGVTKGLVQKEWLERLKKQKRFSKKELSDSEVLESIRKHTLLGGYALIHYEDFEDYTPGDNVVHVFAMGALVAEAIQASDLLLEKGIYANVFVVTSSDLLLGNFAFENDYDHLRNNLNVNNDLHLHPSKNEKGELTAADLKSLEGSQIPILSVHDGEPGLLDNIGSVVGVKQHCMAIRKTSKSGTTKDIFYLHHLDSNSLADEAVKLLEKNTAQKFIVSS